jgi:hypothetical protein
MRGWLMIFAFLGLAGTAYSFTGTHVSVSPTLSLSGLFFALLVVGLVSKAVGGRTW